jgi:hypothetical protein
MKSGSTSSATLANCAIIFQGLLRACPDEIGVYQFRHFGSYIAQFPKVCSARFARRSFGSNGLQI